MNWFIPAAYNQAHAGKFCGQTPDSEVVKYLGGTCRKGLSQPADLSASLGWDLIHKMVFEDAALKQLESDECMAQVLGKLQTDEKKRKSWVGNATEAWLVYKKVKLIRNQCLVIDHREAMGKPIDSSELEKWKVHCDNPTAYNAMWNAEKLFSFALPILSDEKVYEKIEDNRAFVTSSATGKPITDEEILAMDMRSFKGKVTFQPGMSKSLLPIVDEALKERGEAIKKLSDARAAGTLQDLDRDVRNYLYEMGAVKEVMVDKGIVKIDKDGTIKETSYGANCIFAWYDPTIVGELLDIVTLSAVGAGPASKAVKFVAPALKAAGKIPYVGPYIAKLATPLSTFGASKMAMGMFVGTAGDATKQVFKNCFGDLKDTKRLKDNTDEVKKNSVEINALPLLEGEYYGYGMTFKPAEVPACKNHNEKRNFALNADFHTNCVKEALMSVLPIQYSLMLMATPD